MGFFRDIDGNSTFPKTLKSAGIQRNFSDTKLFIRQMYRTLDVENIKNDEIIVSKLTFDSMFYK